MVNNRQEHAKRYLPGQMSQQEAAQFEAQYFADDDLFREMTALEDELLDSFVRGELTSAEAQEFQKEYLTSPARKAKAGFARVLAEHLSGSAKTASSDSPQARFPKGISIFPRVFDSRKSLLGIVAALLIIASLVFANLRLRHELEQLKAQQAELQRREQDLRKQVKTPNGRSEDRNKDLQAHHDPKLDRQKTQQAELQQSQAPYFNVPPPRPAPESTIASLVLSPVITRSAEGSKVLRLSSKTVLVQLQLLVEHDDYFSYKASIETAGGAPVWQQSGLSTQAVSGVRAITVQLPVKILENGNYRIRLTGLKTDGSAEDVGDYSFIVKKSS